MYACLCSALVGGEGAEWLGLCSFYFSCNFALRLLLFFIIWMKLSVELYLFQTFDCEMVVILVTFEGKRWTILDLYVASYCQ